MKNDRKCLLECILNICTIDGLGNTYHVIVYKPYHANNIRRMLWISRIMHLIMQIILEECLRLIDLCILSCIDLIWWTIMIDCIDFVMHRSYECILAHVYMLKFVCTVYGCMFSIL